VVNVLAYLPFRVVYVPTAFIGRVVARLAKGYRTASPLQRALILPAWAVLRGVFLVGWSAANALHSLATRTLDD